MSGKRSGDIYTLSALAQLAIVAESLSEELGRVETATASLAPAAQADAGARRDERAEAFAGGRYQVRRFLGEGGKKRVYLGHDTRFDREVAIAVIKVEGLDEAGRARIRREARAMGRLGDHPHIVTVFDVGEESGQPYIVSQFMAGGSVEDLLRRTERARRRRSATAATATNVPASRKSAPRDAAGAGATAAHSPARPGRLHAWFGPSQGVSQQTPSTQLSDWQSVASVQLLPSGPPVGWQPLAQLSNLPHVPPMRLQVSAGMSSMQVLASLRQQPTFRQAQIEELPRLKAKQSWPAGHTPIHAGASASAHGTAFSATVAGARPPTRTLARMATPSECDRRSFGAPVMTNSADERR
jgi:hypothetical protein